MAIALLSCSRASAAIIRNFNSFTYITEERKRITENMSRDHHPPLRDVTAETEKTQLPLLLRARISGVA
jgi:hypothetical protein